MCGLCSHSGETMSGLCSHSGETRSGLCRSSGKRMQALRPCFPEAVLRPAPSAHKTFLSASPLGLPRPAVAILPHFPGNVWKVICPFWGVLCPRRRNRALLRWASPGHYFLLFCRTDCPAPSGGTIFLLVKKDSGERHAKGPSSSQAPYPSFCLEGKSSLIPLLLLSPANPLTLGFAGVPVFGDPLGQYRTKKQNEAKL